MMDSLKKGTVCPICSKEDKNRYYRTSEGRYSFCKNHTTQEITNWQIKPARQEPKIKNWEN
jgi:hypothetical protein